MVAKKETVLSKEKLNAYKETSLGWQAENLMIINKKSKLVPLDHNIAQLKVHNAIALQRKYNLPIRLLIYKARQEGISTYIEAILFEMCNRYENWLCCVISMDRTSTAKVFRMCETYQQEMPKDIKRTTDRASAKEIRYAEPHRSSILCQTAGTKNLGRGGTAQGGHYTEVCFWANAKRQLLGVQQEIPDEPNTIRVLETTANGTGNEFSKRYWAAVKRLRNLYKKGKGGKKEIDPTVLRGDIPVFLSWQDFPEYQTPLPRGHRSVPGMTSEIDDYVKEGLTMGVTLTLEQVYFALLKIQNECGGDIDLFKQEYPRTAREAERATGRMVFRPEDLDFMEQNCCEPQAMVEFYKNPSGKVKYREVNKRENSWSIWKYRIKGHSYAGFADPAEGALTDPTDNKSKPDRSVGGILDRNAFDIPAVYYGRPDTIEFGQQFTLACEYYNLAWASPEMNSIGQSLLDQMKMADYPNIYYREKKEEEAAKEDSKKFGWKTTTKTRKPLVADLVKVTRERELVIYDIRVIDEMRVFVYNPQGKPKGMAGETDDCVIMVGGLLQMHIRCPWNTDEDWDHEEEKTEKPINVLGASDPGDDDIDDEDFSFLEGEDVDESIYEDMSIFE